jgi:hypothetical protein
LDATQSPSASDGFIATPSITAHSRAVGGAAFGFRELGWSAADYRAAFRENRLETLRRHWCQAC